MDVFLTKLFLSFLVGGAWIAFSIWISERFGTKLGAILVGLPSTSLVTLIFIAWTQDPSAAVVASQIMPAVMGACALFAAAFLLASRHGELVAFAAAFSVWLAISLPLALLQLHDLAVSIAILAILYLAAAHLVSGFPHKKPGKAEFSRREFIVRAALAGTVVAFAVFMGKALGPLWGGVFASFPAAFSSTLFLLSKKHGMDYATSMARGMPNGTIPCAFFAAVFYFAVPAFGMVSGTVFAYLSSFACAYFVNKYAD